MGLLRVNPFLGRRSKIGSSIRHRRVKGGCVLSLGFGLRLRGLVGLLRRHECLVAVRRVLAIQLRLRLVLLGVVALLLLIPPRLLFVRPFSSISLLSIQNLTVEVDSLGQFILHFHQHLLFCAFFLHIPPQPPAHCISLLRQHMCMWKPSQISLTVRRHLIHCVAKRQDRLILSWGKVECWQRSVFWFWRFTEARWS